ncbi:MAG: pseudouridine synthase [marine bacterium B5-7]|nr:MAG: pseudouridine synthase [marine bacterium B5-7]
MTRHEDGQRLDNYLTSRLKGLPRSRLYRIIRRGEVRINGSRCLPSTRLATGDVVRIPPVRTAHDANNTAPLPKALKMLDSRVLYQDEHLLVIDKPAGVAVHGGSGIPFGVIEALKRSSLAGEFLELGHRLDRDTSGCLVLARTRKALLSIHEAFRREAELVSKVYLALAARKWLDDRGDHFRIDHPLERYRDPLTGHSRMRVSSIGQSAASQVELVRRFDSACLVKVHLETGRMHQARVHLASVGLPVAGDDIYGDSGCNKALRDCGLKRLFLHASTLSFNHPENGQRQVFDAPLAPELSDVIEKLEKI